MFTYFWLFEVLIIPRFYFISHQSFYYPSSQTNQVTLNTWSPSIFQILKSAATITQDIHVPLSFVPLVIIRFFCVPTFILCWVEAGVTSFRKGWPWRVGKWLKVSEFAYVMELLVLCVPNAYNSVSGPLFGLVIMFYFGVSPLKSPNIWRVVNYSCVYQIVYR